jgi:DNA topoisomerase VI subunit A
LAEFNIGQHTPLMLVSANLNFHTNMGEINLATMPDFAALTPATIKSFQSLNISVTTWMLVENRTSFERVARNRLAHEGVIWLPGYPPSWWKDAVTHLIKVAPAPAKIACDPDPAGIAIALSAMAVFKSVGLEASAWKMGVEELESLSHKKPLSEFDQQQLTGLLNQDLPTELKVLAKHMQTHQQKGEQEGYL